MSLSPHPKLWLLTMSVAWQGIPQFVQACADSQCDDGHGDHHIHHHMLNQIRFVEEPDEECEDLKLVLGQVFPDVDAYVKMHTIRTVDIMMHGAMSDMLSATQVRTDMRHVFMGIHGQNAELWRMMQDK